MTRLSEVLQTKDPFGIDAKRALLLLAAYEDVDESQVELTFGGEAYLRHIMDEVRRPSGELGNAHQAAYRLRRLYALSSSQSSVAGLNGTTYKKHVDWVSSTCGSDRCDTIVTYTFEL